MTDEMVCPWCGFNKFSIYHDHDTIIYVCQTCTTEPLTHDKLVSYSDFDRFCREYYMESPDVLVKLWEECYDTKFDTNTVRGFTCYELKRMVNSWLGIPQFYEDKYIFWMRNPGEDFHTIVYEKYLKNPRIALDYRDINRIYNKFRDYNHISIEKYLVNLVLKSKRDYKPRMTESCSSYQKQLVSCSDNCGGGNIGQAIHDFDTGW